MVDIDASVKSVAGGDGPGGVGDGVEGYFTGVFARAGGGGE